MNKHWPNRKSKWSKEQRNFMTSRLFPNQPIAFYREEKSKMEKFWELLETSTIFQGCITFALVITTCYLWASGKPVPSELWFANTIVIGFFFGSKSSQMTDKIQKIRKG